MLAASFDRAALDQVRWDKADAITVLTETATEHLLSTGSPNHELLALDLTSEPDLQALLDAVDIVDDHGVPTVSPGAAPQPAPVPTQGRSTTSTATPPAPAPSGPNPAAPAPAAASDSSRPAHPSQAGRPATARLVSRDELCRRLRPSRLGDVIGQQRIVDQLATMLHAAQATGRPAGHMLLSAGPGMGKATLAGVLAGELGVALRPASGEELTSPGALERVWWFMGARSVGRRR